MAQVQGEEHDAKRRLREARDRVTKLVNAVARAEARTVQAIALAVPEFNRCHDCGAPCLDCRCPECAIDHCEEMAARKTA